MHTLIGPGALGKPARIGGGHFRKIPIFPLIVELFELKTPRHFQDVLGDNFARVESSGDPNPTMFVIHFHDVVTLDPLKES